MTIPFGKIPLAVFAGLMLSGTVAYGGDAMEKHSAMERNATNMEKGAMPMKDEMPCKSMKPCEEKDAGGMEHCKEGKDCSGKDAKAGKM